MIDYRKLNKEDRDYLEKMINEESINFKIFLRLGWSIDQIYNQLNKNSNMSFGGFYKKKLVSFVLGDLFNIEKISEYEILVMYVCKNYRKKGFGSKLLTIIEENNKNLKKIYLEVGKNNLEGISFYKKMNFKKIDIRKNYFLLDNKKIDALLMCKSL